MSFPGYFKSISLRQGSDGERRGKTINNANSKDGQSIQIKGRADDTNQARFRNRQNSFRGRAQETLRRSPSPQEHRNANRSAGADILDDKGNAPTPSLWIGNVSVDISSNQLRTAFGTYGKILSIRQKSKYCFVNFENLEDAIAAWKACDDQELFESGKRNFIRFAKPEAEVRHSKDHDSVGRRYSFNTKFQTSQQEFNESVGDAKRCLTGHAHEPHWPNGPPPTGPRSHQKEISPPPLHRSLARAVDRKYKSERREPDVYRPQQERSWSHGRVGSRGRGLNCRSSRKWSESPNSRSSRSHSRLTTRSSSRESSMHRSRTTSPTVPHQMDTDPDLQEQRLHSVAESSNLIIQSGDEQRTVMSSEILVSCNSINVQTSGGTGKSNDLKQTNEANADDTDDHYSPTSQISSPGHDAQTLDTDLSFCAPMETSQYAYALIAPSTLPNKRLRVDKDETSSVVSGMTSSTKSSLRKKKCTDCRKPGNDLSPIVTCSMCPRRFHSGCGDPRPSSYVEQSEFTCGRCLRQETRRSTERMLAYTAERNILPEHLACGPREKESNEVAISPREPPSLHIDTIMSAAQVSDSHSPHASIAIVEAQRPGTARLSEQPARRYHMVSDTNTYNDACSLQVIANSQGAVENYIQEHARDVLRRYKTVTCHHWKLGSCWLREPACMWAHENTGIQLPDGKTRCKQWTCFEWLSGDRCPHNAHYDLCLYAHQDTGLHVWKDGKASHKHITCYWWMQKGACKNTEQDCRFAHKDTGIYSPYPSERRQIGHSGSAMSFVRPISAVRVPSSQQDPTDAAFPMTAGYRNVTNQASTSVDAVRESTSASPRKAESETHIKKRRLGRSWPSSRFVNTTSENMTSPVYQDPLSRLPPHADLATPAQTPTDDVFDHSFSMQLDVARPVFTRRTRPIPLPSPQYEEVEHTLQIGAGFPVRGDSIDSTNCIPESPNSVRPQRPRLPTPALTGEAKDQIDTSAKQDIASHSIQLLEPTEATPSRPYISLRAEGAPELSMDPRKVMLARSGTELSKRENKIAGSGVSQENTGTLPVGRDLTGSFTDSSTKSDQSPSSSTTRRCRICQRIVFKNEICKTCKEQRADLDSLVVESSRSKPESKRKSVSQSNDGVDSADASAVVTGDFRHIQADIHGQPFDAAPVISLKRINSLDNMFIPNKRPKHSMWFSQPAPRRINRNSPLPKTQTTPFISTNVVDKVPTPTIDELTRAARISNGKEVEDCLINQPQVDPIRLNRIDIGQIKRGSNVGAPSTEDQTLPSAMRPIEGSSTAHGKDTEETQLQHNNSSPESPSSQTYSSDCSQTETPESTHSTRSSSEEPLARRGQRSFDVRVPARDIVVVEPKRRLGRTISCLDCSRRHIRCVHKTTVLESPRNRRVTLPAAEQIADLAISKKLPDLCEDCRSARRKCLHDEHGQLDPEKCLNFVVARKWKQDLGRAKAQWLLITEAARRFQAAKATDVQDSEQSEISPDESSSPADLEYVNAGRQSSIDAQSRDESDSSDDPHNLKSARHVSRAQYSASNLIQQQRVLIQSPSRVDGRYHTHRLEAEPQTSPVKHDFEGIVFESDSDDDSYTSVGQICNSAKHVRPIDPLYRRPKASRDLYEISPELNVNCCSEAINSPQRVPKISRKEEWKNLKSRQLQDRYQKFGNPHWEVDRKHTDVQVTAIVRRHYPGKDLFDPGATQEKDEMMTFREFLGAPQEPLACLMSDGRTLAFRDVGKDSDIRDAPRTATRFGKRDRDDGLFPVLER